ANCGSDIVNNDSPPSEFIKVVYFEAWNRERQCLWWDITEIDLTGVTHIHFAFGRLTPSFDVDVSHVQTQFDRFRNLDGPVKRILAFGGWADSTEEGRYQILRSAMIPENHQGVARKLVDFVESTGMDGIDIDWEYPGARDIPDVDP